MEQNQLEVNCPPVSDDLLAAMDAVGEPFAAGFMSTQGEPVVVRVAEGLRRYARQCPLWEYAGQRLYPTGGPALWDLLPMTVWFRYVRLQGLNGELLRQKRTHATDPLQLQALDAIEQFWTAYPFDPPDGPLGGYTHSIPHYARVLREGLTGYSARVEAGLRRAVEDQDDDRRGFYRAMEIVLDTAEILRQRYVERISAADLNDGQAKANRQRLLTALERMPLEPASSFYDAMVAENLVFYLDGSDNPGRFDQDLWAYYAADLERGRTSHDEALHLVAELWENLNACSGYNVALAGTTPDGEEASNELTLVCMEAAHGKRRPNLALRLRRDTPEKVWDAALDCIATGNGLPALYAEENYLAAIREADLNIPEPDMAQFAFGGCTELMVHGRSNCGSLDADINLLEHLSHSLTTYLPTADSFEAFLQAYLRDLAAAIEDMTQQVSTWQRHKALYHPQPIRSLLIDDCVDEGTEYAAGGARYNWSVINVVGLANVVDSLTAVREVVFETGECSADELLKALEADYDGYEVLRQRLQRCPRYGNGDPRADELAHRVSEFVFARLLERVPWRGGRFLGSCLMFVTYADFGKPVPATPDGRRAGEPVADSAGAYQGRDVSGPTALLRSAAQLDQIHAPGTLVVNVRLAKSHFATPRAMENLKALIRGYFDLGGMQLQITVVDQETLRDALADPDRHGDIIVRVGGYSEYWKNLTPEIRRTILQRTEH